MALRDDAAASTASRPNVRDDGQRPSGRDGGGYSFDLPDGLSEIFFRTGLDRPNHVDPPRQIGPFKQRPPRHFSIVCAPSARSAWCPDQGRGAGGRRRLSFYGSLRHASPPHACRVRPVPGRWSRSWRLLRLLAPAPAPPPPRPPPPLPLRFRALPEP